MKSHLFASLGKFTSIDINNVITSKWRNTRALPRVERHTGRGRRTGRPTGTNTWWLTTPDQTQVDTWKWAVLLPGTSRQVSRNTQAQPKTLPTQNLYWLTAKVTVVANQCSDTKYNTELAKILINLISITHKVTTGNFLSKMFNTLNNVCSYSINTQHFCKKKLFNNNYSAKMLHIKWAS